MLNVWNRWPRRTRHSRSLHYPRRSLPPFRPPGSILSDFFFLLPRLLTLVYPICDRHPLEVSHNEKKSEKSFGGGGDCSLFLEPGQKVERLDSVK